MGGRGSENRLGWAARDGRGAPRHCIEDLSDLDGNVGVPVIDQLAKILGFKCYQWVKGGLTCASAPQQTLSGVRPVHSDQVHHHNGDQYERWELPYSAYIASSS